MSSPKILTLVLDAYTGARIPEPLLISEYAHEFEIEYWTSMASSLVTPHSTLDLNELYTSSLFILSSAGLWFFIPFALIKCKYCSCSPADEHILDQMDRLLSLEKVPVEDIVLTSVENVLQDFLETEELFVASGSWTRKEIQRNRVLFETLLLKVTTLQGAGPKENKRYRKRKGSR